MGDNVERGSGEGRGGGGYFDIEKYDADDDVCGGDIENASDDAMIEEYVAARTAVMAVANAAAAVNDLPVIIIITPLRRRHLYLLFPRCFIPLSCRRRRRRNCRNDFGRMSFPR